MIVALSTLSSRRHNQSHCWRLGPSRSSMRLILIGHKVGCCLGNLVCPLQSTIVAVIVGALVQLGHCDGQLPFRRQYIALGLLARRGRDGDGKVVFVLGVIRATTVPFAEFVACQRHAVLAEACGITRRVTLVVSVVCFCTLCCRLLLIGRALRAFGPLMFCRATQVAVHFARGALAPAVLFAASRGFPLSRLIVARGIPIASRVFATVALQCSVGGATVVATAIVVDTTMTMAPISTVEDVVASIVTESNLAFGALAVPDVGGLAEPSVELLRSLCKGDTCGYGSPLGVDHTDSSPGVNP